ERGIACMYSKEPTGLKWGRKLRRSAREGRLSLEEELQLFELDRRDHISRAIQPALNAGGIVILDRYYWSTAAYQGARGADVAKIMESHAGFAPVPDIVLVLDLDPDRGLARIRNQGDNPNPFEDPTALTAIREIFLSLAKSRPEGRIIPADGNLKECFEECLQVLIKAGMNKLAAGLSAEAAAEKLEEASMLVGETTLYQLSQQ
ncbi:MAG: dTMP kinase, partial [Verrucomicrobiaceae bacterium]